MHDAVRTRLLTLTDLQLLKTTEKEGLLRTIVDCLQLARRIYLAPVVHYLLPLLQTPERGRVLTQLQRGFHTVVSYSLPWSKISPLLGGELAQDALIILGIDTLLDDAAENEGEGSQDEMEVDRQYSVSYEHWKNENLETRAQMMTEGEDERVTMARDRLLAFLNGLQQVGLGGDKAQKVFASVMNIMMTEFIRAAYTNQWEAPTSVPQHLRHWIENIFARLAVQVLAIIHTPQTGNQSSSPLDVSFGDVEKWQEMGIARLGALRTSELFDVIVEWPASSGAVEDLRHFTTHPAARLHVTQSFITILTQRLLHPGASTVEILQVYISIIRAFHLLDPKGVLLDRIARPIRRYLRDRDDTIKVIVSGLLADPAAAATKPPSNANETLVELSTELSKAHQLSMENNTSELDWDDMNWMPDPVDAAPDYRKSKSSDVIDSVISLFDSKETFVKELQTLLSDRLLQKREKYDQEISVLELLKVRFGDSALQPCEVMLRDISDSHRVNIAIRKDQGLIQPPARINKNKRLPVLPIPDLHAKILSRFFWPEIQDQEFKIPDEVASLQRRYAAGFEALKASRKLTWRNGLGQVLVELQLSDRDFSEEVTTWQATVIHAFHSDYDEATSRTISSLSTELEMSPSLVRSACLFWVSKRILIESSRDEFSVLESLPSEDEDKDFGIAGADPTDADPQSGDVSNAAAAAEAAAAAAAKESADAAAMEKMNLYWQFIVGMLTNQGAMPLARVVMMLKIVVPGGFPFSNEELREFLAGMVAKGKLEIVSGGNYKIVP
jgi:anaphase-promoting complex subunit 2